MQNLITPGQLAKLAGTTKRTILWYDQLGIIKPVEVSSSGYRFYDQSQVLDYQMILLLTTLGVSLKEISQKHDLTSLFTKKKVLIKNQINNLQFNLNNLIKFQKNINQTKTLVNPQIKILKPFSVYYLNKIGAYVDIDKYCQQLLSMFPKSHQPLTTLAIFDVPTYQPHKSRYKIAVIAKPSLSVLPHYQSLVKYLKFSPGKVITYTHNGAGELLSLFWKELEKYCRLHKIKVRKSTPDFEIYRHVSSDPRNQFFEIYLPIY